MKKQDAKNINILKGQAMNKCDTCKYLINIENNDKTVYCAKKFLPDNMYPFEFGCIYYKIKKNNK